MPTTSPDRCRDDSRSRSHQRLAARKTGFATVWIIVGIPVTLCLLCSIIEVANLWLARVELENALEAAAMAAVKEWGDAGGTPAVNWTLDGRNTGVDFAAANTVGGIPLMLTTNINTADTPNENATPDGNLLFGAYDETTKTFDCGDTPSCGVGTVLADASGQGNLDANDNEWGISFQSSINAALRISSVVIDLRASGGGGSFTGTPTLSTTQIIPGQNDVSGFSDPAAQISFDTSQAASGLLTINFTADPNAPMDDGFAPGDRIRFGLTVANVSSGSGGDDGDGIGRDGARVTVNFNVAPSSSGIFFDNTESSNDCTAPPIVHPTGIPNLPCPPAAAPNNNGQSYALLQGGGTDDFAVRAQATVAVNTICCQVFGVTFSSYNISAKATARYLCTSGRVELVRVDTLICP